jgi:hypothetical protein
MSQPITKAKGLAHLLDQYSENFYKLGASDEALLKDILNQVPLTNDPEEFRLIANQVWDKYFCVDAEVVAKILRRWLEIEPHNKEARVALANYLLAHGLDWDEEANQLLHDGS